MNVQLNSVIIELFICCEGDRIVADWRSFDDLHALAFLIQIYFYFYFVSMITEHDCLQNMNQRR